MTAATDTPGFDTIMGFEFTEKDKDRIVLTWTLGPEHLQPYGMAHGGVYCSAVEHAASMGAALNIGENAGVVGVSNSTDFLRPAGPGTTLTAIATPIHRGRSAQLWLVEIKDGADRLIARGQVRFQTIPADATRMLA